MSITLEKMMKSRLNPESLNAVTESSWLMMNNKEIDTEQEMRHVNLEKKRQNRLNSVSQNLVAESSSSTATENAGDNTTQAADQSQVRPTSTGAATLQYFDRWFDTPVTLREADSYTETRHQTSSKEDDSYSEAEDGDNIVLLKKYGTSPSVESVDQDYSLISFNERLRRSKKAYSGDHDGELKKPPSKESTVDETGDWHAVEDSSEYEIVERS